MPLDQASLPPSPAPRPGVRRLLWVIDGALWAALAAFFVEALRYHYGLASFPYQLYLTEGGDLQSARALLNGWDPWSVRYAPEYVNLYGIGYPWLVAQVSRFAASVNLIVLMRSVTASAIFLALGIVYRALRAQRSPALVAAACCAALYAVLLFSVDTLSARPDALIVALLLACIVLAQTPDLGYALGAGVLAGSAFYIKANGLLVLAVVVSLYGMQRQWRLAILAAGAGVLAWLALAAIVLWRHPLFFEGSLAHMIHRRNFELSWMLRQWKNLYRFNRPWEFGLVAGFLWAYLKKRPLLPPGAWRLWAGVSALIFAALATGPGGHTGAWLDYYHQLWIPAFVVAGALWLLAVGLPHRWVALALLLNGALILGIDEFYVPSFSPAQIQAWDEADAWVAQHPQGLYPSIFTSLSARHGGFVADNDHSHGLDQCFFGDHKELPEAFEARNISILQALSRAEFQSVVCGQGNRLCPDAAKLRSLGYVEARQFHLAIPYIKSVLDLVAYLPKNPPK